MFRHIVQFFGQGGTRLKRFFFQSGAHATKLVFEAAVS
jgi:hypothetical protein